MLGELFSAGAGGPSAPGASPWYNIGGATRSSGRAGGHADVAASAVAPGARLLLPWEKTKEAYFTGRQQWGVPGQPETYQLVTKRERPGYMVDYLLPSGEVVRSVRDRSFQKLFRRGAAGVARAAIASPGVLGLVAGLSLPWVLPFKWSLAAGAAIGVGGYASPQGSWFRRFSIGAGIGGAVSGGVQLYQAIPTWEQLGAAAAVDLMFGAGVRHGVFVY